MPPAFDPKTLLQSPSSLQAASGATGGVAEVDNGEKRLQTGTFNFGGSSNNILLLGLAGLTIFYLLKKSNR